MGYKNQLALINAKYENILKAIGSMEKGSEDRWTYLQCQSEFVDIIEDLMNVLGNNAFSRLKNALRNMDSETADRTTNADIRAKNQCDPLIMTEVLREVVLNYDPSNIEFGFAERVKWIYGKKKDTHLARTEFESRTGGASVRVRENNNGNSSDSSHLKRKKNALLKFCKKYEEIANESYNREENRYFTTEEKEQALKEVLAEAQKAGVSESDIITVEAFFYNGKSLDSEIDESEGEESLADIIKDEGTASPEEVILAAESVDLRNVFLNFADISELFKKQKRDYYKAFLTNNILDELKFENHKLAYSDIPAGNQDIYEALEPFEEMLYSKIFHHNYLFGAFDKMKNGHDPKRLEEVYAWLLRDGFSLADKEIAIALNRAEGTISKERTKFEQEVLTLLSKERAE